MDALGETVRSLTSASDSERAIQGRVTSLNQRWWNLVSQIDVRVKDHSEALEKWNQLVDLFEIESKWLDDLEKKLESNASQKAIDGEQIAEELDNLDRCGKGFYR